MDTRADGYKLGSTLISRRPHNLNDELTLDEQVADILARDQGRDYRFDDDLKRMQRHDPDLKVARLSIEKTFFMADLFLDGDRDVRTDIDRFVRQIFRDPFGVASIDEVGMAHAFTAAYQSSITSRRVGAAVMVAESLICTGRNDLPKAGGGQQSDSIGAASRDTLDGAGVVGKVRRRRETEALYNERSDVAKDFLVRLFSSSEWLAELAQIFPGAKELTDTDRTSFVGTTLKMDFIKDTRIFDLIEFNPSVHAEMSAVTTAARMGFPIAGGLLYTTTFPCHECTRHIILSGLKKVVYLEPYAKSRAAELFADQIRLSRPALKSQTILRESSQLIMSPSWVSHLGVMLNCFRGSSARVRTANSSSTSWTVRERSDHLSKHPCRMSWRLLAGERG